MNKDSSTFSNQLTGAQFRSISNYVQSAPLHTPSNIRIRGKSKKYIGIKRSIEYSSREEFLLNSHRKNIILASQRLKTLEQYEQNKLKDIKEEIQKLEDKHNQVEYDKKRKRELIIERRKKLNDDRKKLEIKKAKRLASKESNEEWAFFNY